MAPAGTDRFKAERFKKRDAKPPMIDTVCLGLLFFFCGSFSSRALFDDIHRFDLTSFLFTQEPFNLSFFVRVPARFVYFFLVKPIFPRDLFHSRGGTSVANKTVKWKLPEKVKTLARISSGFFIPSTGNATSILVCGLWWGKSTGGRQFENQTSAHE